MFHRSRQFLDQLNTYRLMKVTPTSWTQFSDSAIDDSSLLEF
jgi:hypothetical protein